MYNNATLSTRTVSVLTPIHNEDFQAKIYDIQYLHIGKKSIVTWAKV
jgi:hypothetical protein